MTKLRRPDSLDVAKDFYTEEKGYLFIQKFIEGLSIEEICQCHLGIEVCVVWNKWVRSETHFLSIIEKCYTILIERKNTKTRLYEDRIEKGSLDIKNAQFFINNMKEEIQTMANMIGIFSDFEKKQKVSYLSMVKDDFGKSDDITITKDDIKKYKRNFENEY